MQIKNGPFHVYPLPTIEGLGNSIGREGFIFMHFQRGILEKKIAKS